MPGDPLLPRDRLIYLIVEPSGAGMTALRFSLKPPALGTASAAFRLRGAIMDATALDVDLVSSVALLPPGPAGTMKVGSVSTGDPGSAVTVANSGTASAAVLDISIPAGKDATPPTIAVGKVTTLAAGSAATVKNSGTPMALTLDFGIPIGATGPAAATLLGTVQLLDKATAALVLGVRSVTITGVTGLKAGDGVHVQPAAAPPAGYLITSALALQDGVLTVTFYGPALAVGAATTIALKVFRLNA